jgi:voltage-gated potassium channel
MLITSPKTLREQIRFYLIDCETVPGKLIDISLLLLNLLVCLTFVLEGYFPQYLHLFYNIETTVIIIFVLEFILRLYAAEDRKAHILSPYTIIDAIAIFPTIIGWVLPGSRYKFFSTLRVFRLFRVFRFLRFMETEEFFFGRVTEHHLRIIRLVTSLSILFFVSAGMLYTVESAYNDNIATFGDALYFSIVTLTTVGFGDITPVTELGRIVTVIMIMSGIGIIPWQAGQIVVSFMRINHKVEVTCKSCGLKYHEKDASHCKHCGAIIYQEIDG